MGLNCISDPLPGLFKPGPLDLFHQNVHAAASLGHEHFFATARRVRIFRGCHFVAFQPHDLVLLDAVALLDFGKLVGHLFGDIAAELRPGSCLVERDYL